MIPESFVVFEIASEDGGSLTYLWSVELEMGSRPGRFMHTFIQRSFLSLHCWLVATLEARGVTFNA